MAGLERDAEGADGLRGFVAGLRAGLRRAPG